MWGEEMRGKCRGIFWFLHTRVRERVRSATPLCPFLLIPNFGGEGGIRTHGDREATTLFESVPFVHSGTSPVRILAAAFSPSRAAAR